MSLERDLVFTCRICLETEQNRLTRLISPCTGCKGTMKYVHRSCFIHWLNKSKSLNCELCHSPYQNLIIRAKPSNFLDFIRREPEWFISFVINLVPLIYDVYFIKTHSELNFNQMPSPSSAGHYLSSSNPITTTIQLSSVNLNLFFSFSNALNINLKSIPITFPIEILNMAFFLRDLCARFKRFKRLNQHFEIDFRD